MRNSTFLIFLLTLLSVSLVSPSFSQGRDGDDDDNDFAIIVKGGLQDEMGCIDSQNPYLATQIQITLFNLPYNPPVGDIVVGLTCENCPNGTIYSYPLNFQCNEIEQRSECNCPAPFVCTANASFDFPEGFFMDFCEDYGYENSIIEFTVELFEVQHVHHDLFNYVPLIPEPTDCYGWFPPCMNLDDDYEPLTFGRCVDCELIGNSANGTTNRSTMKESNEKIMLYPIPTTEELNISSEENTDFEITQIVNPLGQNYSIVKGSNNEAINIEHLPNGIYYLVLKTLNGKIVKSFVKN